MPKVPITQILAISPEFNQSAVDLRSNLIERLIDAGLPYLHIGAGVRAAYVVLPINGDQQKLKEVAESCNAIVSGSGYLRLEKYGLPGEEVESVEQALVKSPINYDIPLEGHCDQIIGVCDMCGGVGGHIGPPCRPDLN